MKSLRKWAYITSCLAGLQAVWADTITILPYPDVSSSTLSVSYDATSGVFEATGIADTLSSMVSGSPETLGIDSGSFTLTANISNAGVASTGSMAVSGCVVAHPDQFGCGLGSTLLQSATLSSLAFTDFADSELVFGFATMSGDLQAVMGSVVHVKMSLFGFPGNFTQSFTTSEISNTADVGVNAATGVVPEPGTWALMASGIVLVTLARRRIPQPAR
jgi:hypothetical protein